ncbi:unnamed protein product [Menidia menidia]|uniref:(Atlantic silverside) hypothetical protein n=1 Tax=Menidia menidia TaxID=238744 RepID=A0A8S4BFW7_9TELE|nr:unnamed protein product [Menidia menidia]
MSFTTNPTLVPDRGSLPLKKRDQRAGSPLQQQLQRQTQSDAVHFKAPYPYKSQNDSKHMGPFRPVPRRVPPLYQPWMQTHAPNRPKQHIPSTFREHHGWAEWTEFNALPPGLDFSHQHQNHLFTTQAFQPGHHLCSSRFGAVSLVAEGFRRGREGQEKLRTLKDNGWNPERQSYGKHKGPYAKRDDRKIGLFPRPDKASPSLLSTCLPHPLHKDIAWQRGSLHNSTKAVSVSGRSLMRVSLENSDTTTTNETSRPPTVPSPEHPASPSNSANRFPWLLPHFVAGSLIELKDGRLRKVEHLQTEDFLLGSLACPDLHLSCCTVKSISPSAYSSSVSRLLILLHDQQSQELVDVYVEYPFFVRGQGWSSCSPQRTARLCGLRCRQLSVGDTCLALTPVCAPEPSPSTSPGPKTSPGKAGGGREPVKVQTAPRAQVPLQLKQLPEGQRAGKEAARRRHYSAP